MDRIPAMTKVLSIISAIPACFLIYYGTVMLFMVPGDPGEPYLSAGRFVYGCLPFGAGLLLALIARWIWKRQ